jgi:hypothetical protein
MNHSKRAGSDDAAPAEPAATSAAALPVGKTLATVLIILTALFGVLLATICGDALVGAFVLAALDMVGATRTLVDWTEGVFLVASLVPAALLFRHALASERAMWGVGSRRPG